MEHTGRQPSPAETFGDTFRRLRQSQKSMRNAPAWSRWINRPFGRALAVVAYRRNLTPNQVTILSATSTFTGIAILMLARPQWPIAVGVALLLVLGHALDAADGQLARLRGGGSAFGEWLDHVVDAAKSLLVHVAVLISLYRFGDLPADEWLLVPLAFGFVDTTLFFANVLKDQLRIGRLPAGETDAYLRPDVVRSPILPSLLLSVVDYGVLCLSIVTLPWTRLFLAVYTALLVAKTVYLAVGLRRWGRVVAGY